MLRPSLRAASLAIGLGLASCASLPPPTPFHTEAEPKTERSVDVLVGQRQYVSDDWEDVDQPMFGGLETWWHRPGEPLAWELTGQYAADDADVGPDGKKTGRVAELSGGLRYLFGPLAKSFHPYASAGGSVLWAELEQDAFGYPSFDDEGWDFGVYARAGIFAYLVSDIWLGLDVRTLQEEWISAGTFDLDYWQVAITIGADW